MTCNTSLLVWWGVSNIFTMLNYITHLKLFKHFGSSTCSHVNNQSNHTYGQHAIRDWTWTCEHVEDRKCLKNIRCFCCYYSSTKTSFCFCSCSELLQQKFGKKNLSGKCKLFSPQDSYRLQMKDIHHIYNFVKRLLCEFLFSLGVKVAQS